MQPSTGRSQSSSRDPCDLKAPVRGRNTIYSLILICTSGFREHSRLLDVTKHYDVAVLSAIAARRCQRHCQRQWQVRAVARAAQHLSASCIERREWITEGTISGAEAYILRFQVAVHNAERMQMAQREHNLRQVEPIQTTSSYS